MQQRLGPRLYTYEEAGDELHISERTVRRLVKEGTLKAVRIQSRVFIKQEEIAHYVEGLGQDNEP